MIRSIFFGIAILSAFQADGAWIKRKSNPQVAGLQCPSVTILYRLEDLGNCGQIEWSVEGGYIVGASNQVEVNIVWNDEVGLTGRVSATYTCVTYDSNNNPTYTTASDQLDENILSMNDLSWTYYIDHINRDFCETTPLTVNIPNMIVFGYEVIYEWIVPSGWVTNGDVYPNLAGIQTDVSQLTITPTLCASSGVVKFQGIYVRGFNCTQGQPSAIGTFTINGHEPTLSLSTAGGFSQSLPCVTTPVMFTASLSSAPSCPPSYKYTFPSGWRWLNPISGQFESGPAVTTNYQVQLKPSGTSSDAGNIVVQAVFNCGSVVTSSPYNITYSPPTISATPDPLCTTGQFSVINPTGLPIVWTSSNPSIMTISSSGINTAIGTRIANSAGSITINATLSCGAAAIPKTIWVGWPDPTNSAIVYEYFHPGANPITLNAGAAYQFAMSPVNGASIYTWQIPKTGGWSFWIYGAQSNPNVIITGTQGSYTLICKPGNACGIAGSRTLAVNLVPGGGGGGGGIPLSVPEVEMPVIVADQQYFTFEQQQYEEFVPNRSQWLSVSPNPASKTVLISLSYAAEKDTELNFLNLNGELVHTGFINSGTMKIEVSVEKLPPGIYLVMVKDGRNSGFKKLVVTK